MRILVATDGSDSATRALDFAARLTKDLGGSLQILNVISAHDLPPQELVELARMEHMQPGAFLDTISRQILTAASERARNLGVSDVQSASQIGDVATSIIKAAEDDATDVIAVGKRGLGRLSRLLLGSVSQKVVALAPCAVIVVP